MLSCARLLAAAVIASIASSAGAQQERPQRGGPESLAGVCAYAPMEPTERLEACNLLLQRSNLPPEARALAHLGRAMALRRVGEPAKADADIDRAIALSPRLAQAYVVRGSIRLSRRDVAGAIADASEAIEINRRNPAGYLLRAEAYLNQRQAAFALGDMDDAIALAPNAPRLRLVRAYAHMALGQPERAVADARDALKLEPDMTAGYLVRAQAYLSTHAFARAGADAARAVELAPGDRRAWDAAAIAYTELVRFEDAVRAAEKLVDLAPESAASLNAHCWILALKPDPAAAMPSCHAALEADDGFHQAYDSRAFAYWQLGDHAAARADLEKAAELAPDFWDWSAREDRFALVLARRYLKSLGHYDGPLDGEFDDLSETEKAIRAFQADAGLPTTGEADAELLDQMARKIGVN